MLTQARPATAFLSTWHWSATSGRVDPMMIAAWHSGSDWHDAVHPGMPAGPAATSWADDRGYMFWQQHPELLCLTTQLRTMKYIQTLSQSDGRELTTVASRLLLLSAIRRVKITVAASRARSGPVLCH